MNPIVLGGAMQAGSGILGSVASIINTNKTNKANKALAEYSYSKDLEMWNRQNEYNSPTSQMERYRSAGLNPNLIYGSGTASAGNASTLPKYNAPSMQYHYEAPNVAPAIGTYMDLKAKNAQIQSINEDITAKRLQNQVTTATLYDAITTKKWLPKLAEQNFYTGQLNQSIKGSEAEYAQQYYKGRGESELAKGSFMARMLEQQLKNSIMANSLQGKTLEKYSADVAGTNLKNEYQSTLNKWYNKGGIRGMSDVLPFLKMMFNR